MFQKVSLPKVFTKTKYLFQIQNKWMQKTKCKNKILDSVRSSIRKVVVIRGWTTEPNMDPKRRFDSIVCCRASFIPLKPFHKAPQEVF